MQPLSRAVLLDRYAKPAETCAEHVYQRVSKALALAEKPAEQAQWQTRFQRAMIDGFVPGGRILANAGMPGGATMINCFVLPLDGDQGFHASAAAAVRTLRAGGGVGYDLSCLPPSHVNLLLQDRHALISPVTALYVLDWACDALRSSRPGAQMAVLRWDHPDILHFVHAKRKAPLQTFNLSVGVTDDFMRAVENEGMATLKDVVHTVHVNGGTYAEGFLMPARQLWNEIALSAASTGEPGLLFLDAINRADNLSYCERITATNPCAEQPLPPFGACCLGSINLSLFVRSAFQPNASFDFTRLSDITHIAVRMLDNVLSTTAWPLEEQQAEALGTRRIGLGITGLADVLTMLGLDYDTEHARAMASSILIRLRDEAYGASVELGREKGVFPRLDITRYLQALRLSSELPSELKSAIRRNGIRNSHLLSIAPAGSISLAFCDNCSPGIEPPLALRHTRKLKRPDGSVQSYQVENHAWRRFMAQPKGSAATECFRTARQIDPQGHLAMLAALTRHVDGGISKTINLPEGFPPHMVGPLFLQAWKLGVKGLTVFPSTVELQEPTSDPHACQEAC